MTRTERATGSPPASSQKPSRNSNTADARRTQLSRSLTKLLRHQAENEKIPISPAGWVKLDDLLAWKGLSRVSSGGAVGVEQVFDVIQADGWTGKGRFEVKYIDEEEDMSSTAATAAAIDTVSTGPTQPLPQLDPTSKNTPGTQSALRHHVSYPSTPASSYLIRATQGHSIATISSSDLLVPLTLSTPDLPTTVVHGTFYGAWPLILKSGGLKSMGRNNVHFAAGPSLDEVLPSLAETDTDPNTELKSKSMTGLLDRNKVISGMRHDAQILLYIDLARCLHHDPDIKWYVSGNSVILAECVQVPMEYVQVAVEIKNGIGVLWRHGEGETQELPDRLKNVPLPRGKGRVHGNGNRQENSNSRGGKEKGRGTREKPRINVERDGVDIDVDIDVDEGGQ